MVTVALRSWLSPPSPRPGTFPAAPVLHSWNPPIAAPPAPGASHHSSTTIAGAAAYTTPSALHQTLPLLPSCTKDHHLLLHEPALPPQRPSPPRPPPPLAQLPTAATCQPPPVNRRCPRRRPRRWPMGHFLAPLLPSYPPVNPAAAIAAARKSPAGRRRTAAREPSTAEATAGWPHRTAGQRPSSMVLAEPASPPWAVSVTHHGGRPGRLRSPRLGARAFRFHHLGPRRWRGTAGSLAPPEAMEGWLLSRRLRGGRARKAERCRPLRP